MWIIIALLIVIFVGGFPYARRALARRRMWKGFCRAIRREGGRVRLLRRFPSLSGNASGLPELLVRHTGVQYAVKLWTPHHTDAELRLVAEGKAFETRTAPSPLAPKGPRRMRTLRGPRYAVRPLHTPAKSMGVLLIAPSYRMILCREGKGWRELAEGETLFGTRVLTPAEFLSLLHQGDEEA